jgi:hypothetical protein
MMENNVNGMGKRLRSAMEPVEDAGPRRDLWPAVLKKMDERSVHVPWFDWVLLAGLAAAVLLFPRVLPALLYHI